MKQVYYILTVMLFLMACTTKQQKDISFDGKIDFNFSQAIRDANQAGKTVLVYFSSYACVNCRTMENNILVNPEVKKSILEDYIFIPLIVDDRTIAAKKYWKQSIFNSDTLKRVGIINSQFQIQLTQSGSQPYFAIVSKDKKVLSTMSYTKDENNFLAFLKGQN